MKLKRSMKFQNRKFHEIKPFLLQVLKDYIKNLIRLMMGAVNNLRSQVNVFNECNIMFERTKKSNLFSDQP